MKVGERVLLVYPPGIEMIAAFFACVRLGLIPVPVYPPTSTGFEQALYRMEFIARDCGAVSILTERSFYWSMKLNQAKRHLARFSFARDFSSTLQWIVSSDAAPNASERVREAHSDVLFLQYTSGSTNDPKGVIVTHDNVLANSDAVVNHDPIGVTWLPQYHDMGLLGYYVYFAIKGGTTYGFSPIDFIRRPALWLETISKHRGTASSAPNFAFEYCLRQDKIPESTFETLDLSSLKFLMNAAEPVRASVYRAFLDKFEPYGLKPKAVFSAYGLAEYTLAVSNHGRTVHSFDAERLRDGQACLVGEEGADSFVSDLVSCGTPLLGTDVRIVRAVGGFHAVPDGQVGEIWIRGPSKCKGYWGRPEQTEAVFEATISGDEEGAWLRSGDQGFLYEKELYICGRLKDLIIIRGLNYYPQDVEILVEADTTIRKGCVAAFAIDKDSREQLVVVAELKNPKREPDPRQINQTIFRRLGIVVDTIVFISPRTIPKTSSGKLQRYQVRQAFLEETLTVLREVDLGSSVDRTALQNPGEAAGPFVQLFHRHGLTGEEHQTLREAGFDSIALANFANDLQHELDALQRDDLVDIIDILLVQNIPISELFLLIQQASTNHFHDVSGFKQVFDGLLTEHQSIDQSMMRQDASFRLSPSMISDHDRQANGGGILLTGGTGFFGPFLLQSLLEQTTDDIYVLVRGEDCAVAKRRLLDGLDALGVADRLSPGDSEQRVHAICGDLSRRHFGLPQSEWAVLAENTHTIFHNGALVNYLYNYAAMRDTNVVGTQEVVRFARTHRSKVLNHISTTFVFGWSVKETLDEDDNNDDMDLLDFGYSQSKWVSEQVVRGAMEQGLQARIFRPALISPSVQGGGYNIDISMRLLAFVLKYRLGTNAKNQVSFSPADVVANNIVAIAADTRGIGKTYHVTRDAYACLADVTQLLGALSDRTIEDLELHDFVPAVIARCTKEDPLYPLVNFFVRSIDNITAMEFKRYDNTNYQEARGRAPFGKDDPSLEDVVLGIYRFMERHGLVEP